MRTSHYLSALALVSALGLAGAAQAQRAGSTEEVMTAEERAEQAQAEADQATREAEAAKGAAQANTGYTHGADAAAIDAEAAAQASREAAENAQGYKSVAQEGNNPTEAAVRAGEARNEAARAKMAAEAANVSAQDAANPPPPPEPRTMADYDPAPAQVAPPPGAVLLPQASASTGSQVWATSSMGNPAPNAHGIDFKSLDTNGDGWLSKREADASGNADLAREFATVDIDNNNKLDRDEVNDW
jgi:hypothetical protein